MNNYRDIEGGLRSLKEQAGENLAEFGGCICISHMLRDNGVDSLLNEKAKCSLDTDVSNLRDLDEDIARRIARQGYVEFKSLNSIEPAEAKVLCGEESKLEEISFSSLSLLSLETCYELGKTRATRLRLGGFEEFSDEQVQALTAFRRKIADIVASICRRLPDESIDMADVPASLLSRISQEIPNYIENPEEFYSSGMNVTPLDFSGFFGSIGFWNLEFSLPDVNLISEDSYKTLNEYGFQIDIPHSDAEET